MRLSKRLSSLPPYLFVEINRKIAQKRANGEEVISFAIGDPDIPTPSSVIESLCSAAHEAENHRYPETIGLLELRQAIAIWYKNRFGVELDANTEVVPLIGSKEGIGHIAFCLIDAGDIALVPDPAYPVYSIGTTLAGGEPYNMPLLEKNNFLPDFDSIPAEVLKKAKVMWLNYPNNPTGATAQLDFFIRAVDFARRNDIVICHDNPYSEIYFSDRRPPSLLEVSKAKDISIEFHSLSKTYNMTGWRAGMAVGNPDIVKALGTLKSNLDSGIPQAIQRAAITALKSSSDVVKANIEVYRKRRDLICEVLSDIGLEINPPEGGLYIWAKVPPGYTSLEFTNSLLDQCSVAVTPGTGYGKYGEGFVRFSLTIHDALLIKGLSKLSGWKDDKHPFKAKTR
ncbi:MAG: LL-diaminopimelate aminotransferase [Dehalococcoidales bacterium]|jgi:LL-diaminopimelate aminotransferase|nr:LL-diaminopimelate aminotransferase [Dehalococcoidales bacterium]MDD5605060.1 LL-diaminopimelate aminotransferase [Dehalococcoidales bacterium]MDX9985930.1 LL-diaminopimelate aminotransferase [Dehalococcoidales bacterium]